MKNGFLKKTICIFTLVVFFLTNVASVYAQSAASLPAAGVMIAPTVAFAPAVLKGMRVYPDQALRFDFIIDKGNEDLLRDDLQNETTKLVRYFLASLTTPEKDLWVNLSPYEGDRIIPDHFGQTEMGRDLLAQDYILKQLTASVIYPESETGKEFWAKLYQRTWDLYGTTDVPVDTFNKVWITPEEATVYVNGQTAVIKSSHLKVLLESDYLAQEKTKEVVQEHATSQGRDAQSGEIAKAVMREVVIPLLEKEVNEGKNFTQLRQIYHAMVLATWFKRNLKESLVGRVYTDQNKVAGIDLAEKNSKDRIWQQYMDAFKKGVFNYIKEEREETTGELIPRKYFSGGFVSNAGRVHEVKASGPEMAEVVAGLKEPPFVAVVDLTIPGETKGVLPNVMRNEKPVVLPVQKEVSRQAKVMTALEEIERSIQEKIFAKGSFRSNLDYENFIKNQLGMPIESIDKHPLYGGGRFIKLVWENFVGKLENGWKNLKAGEYQKAGYSWMLAVFDISQFLGYSPPFVLDTMPTSTDPGSTEYISSSSVKGAYAQTFMNKHMRLYPVRMLLSLALGAGLMYAAIFLGPAAGVVGVVGSFFFVVPPIVTVIAFGANQFLIPEGHELSHVLQRAVIKAAIERLDGIDPSLLEYLARNFQKIELEPRVFYGIGRKAPTHAQVNIVVSGIIKSLRSVLSDMPEAKGFVLTDMPEGEVGSNRPEVGAESTDPGLPDEKSSDVGGIDLDSAQWRFQQTGDQIDLSQGFDGTIQAKDIPGFVPVVFSISPLTDPQTFFAGMRQ